MVLLYAVFLAGIALSGAAIALGFGGSAGHAAVAGGAAILAGVAIAVAIGLGLRGGEAAAGAGRLAKGGFVLGAAVREAWAFLRRGDVRLLGAPAWWVFDAAVLWATFQALGQPPALAVIAFAYFAGQVGNTIPLPGAVSGGMVGTLLAFGVAPDLAITSVLAYRSVAIWLPAPLGLAALASLRARMARWAREDAAAARGRRRAACTGARACAFSRRRPAPPRRPRARLVPEATPAAHAPGARRRAPARPEALPR